MSHTFTSLSEKFGLEEHALHLLPPGTEPAVALPQRRAVPAGAKGAAHDGRHGGLTVRLDRAGLLDGALRRTPRHSGRGARRRGLVVPGAGVLVGGGGGGGGGGLCGGLQRGSYALEALLRQHHLAPLGGLLRFLADGLGQHGHPAVLVVAVVRVEVDDLAVREPDPEALLHKHVAFFLFAEGGPAPRLAALAVAVGLHERTLVVDELGGLGEVYARSRLASHLVVGGKLGTVEAEEAASPVLHCH